MSNLQESGHTDPQFLYRLKPQVEASSESAMELWEKEWLEIKETEWQVDFGLISISGKPGSGTSSAAKILAELYNANLYKAGDTIRELAGAKDRTKFVKRDPAIDEAVDGHIREMVASTERGKPKIAEAQIGGLTVLDTVQELKGNRKYPNSQIIRILFWATKEERVRRLKQASDEQFDVSQSIYSTVVETGTDEEVHSFLRDELIEQLRSTEFITDKGLLAIAETILGERFKILEEGTDEERRELLKILSTELHKKTLKQIWDETTEREKNDQDYWRKLYPNLIGHDNPLEKDAKDAQGDFIYSAPAFDNTDWGTPERSAYEVHRYLAENGIVRPLKELTSGKEEILGFET